MKIVTTNRRASYEYFILDKYEAGIVLTGAEVKSIRAEKINLSDSFAFIKDGEIFLRNCHIAPYEKMCNFSVESIRDRKLLLHSKEIARLAGKIGADGLTLIPLKVYFKDSLVKVELGVCKGKKLYDKRETIKERETKRDTERRIKEYS